MATMKSQAAIKKAAQNTQEAKRLDNSIKGLIKRMEPQIAKALPKAFEPERFTRIVYTALSSNPKLQECTPQSFLGAMMQAAQLGLEPNTPLGQAYLIPYWNSKKRVFECQFQAGYKGILDLAYRTNLYKDIYAHVVYEKDYFEYELGLDQKLVHKPAMVGRGKPIAYYAVYHLINGGYGMFVMSYDDVVNYRNRYSPANKKGSSSPWDTDFDAMAKKTALIQVLKYAPKTTELAEATAADGGVKNIKPEDVTPELDMSLIDTEEAYIDIEPAEPEEAAHEEVPENVDPKTGELFESTGDPDLDAVLAGEGVTK